MAKRKKRNRGGGVPFNPDVDTGTKRPVTARVAVGDVNDKFSDYPSNGLTPRRLDFKRRSRWQKCQLLLCSGR